MLPRFRALLRGAVVVDQGRAQPGQQRQEGRNAMKWRSNSYHMLISSLPALPPRFRRRAAAHHASNGSRHACACSSRRMPRKSSACWRSSGGANQFEEPSDAAVVQRYNALMQDITNPLVRDILAHGMDVRMIVVALRCRRRGLALPTVGMGQWFDHIRHNFNQPDFKLGRVFPWIPEAERLLAARRFADPLPAVCAGGDVDVPEETR